MERELHEGERGELVVWNLFIKSKGIRSVVDVRDDMRFREEDVDFLIEDAERQFTKIEVKTDSMAHRTGNFAYEVESSKTYHTKGCFEKTKADFIAYYVPGLNKIFLVNVGLLRDFVHGSKLKYVEMGDNAIGHLIPFEELEKRRIIHRVYEV